MKVMHKKLNKFAAACFVDTLDNGARVVLFERKGMPIYIRAAFFSGSRFDSIPGTSHFLEHMLLAGTKKFPSKNLIAENIQKVGGDFGASTNNNILRFNVEIPEAEDLDVGIEIISECLINSLFSEKALENERGAIFSEIKNKKNNPKEYINEVQRRVSLQGTEAGRSTLGDVANVGQIMKEDLEQFKKNYLHSGRLTYIVCGDVALPILKEKLNSINITRGEKWESKEKLPIIKDKKVEVENYPGMDHLQVSFSCRTDVESYKEYCALKVLSDILGGDRGARLVTKLRYENGLVYTVFTNIFHSVDWGSLNIKLSCDKANLDKVKELIFAEFTNLRTSCITLEEFKNSKSKAAKGSLRHLQTSESWVGFHEGEAMFSNSELHTVEDYIETINTLEIKDIENVISKYLLEENFVIAICGDYQA